MGYNFKDFKRSIQLPDSFQYAYIDKHVETFRKMIHVGDRIYFFGQNSGQSGLEYVLNEHVTEKMKQANPDSFGIIRKTGKVTAVYPYLVEVEFKPLQSDARRKITFPIKTLMFNELKGLGNIPAVSLRYGGEII